jgi:legumain
LSDKRSSSIMSIMLQTLVVFLALCGLSTARWTAEQMPAYREGVNGTNWAVLVAGSNSWYNYRHQSDVYHSYQLLKKNGFPDSKIIVMHFDDIANNPSNPNPGVVINTLGGPNVYVNVPKDYVGADVTPENFLAVIKGDHSASGRVLQSGPNDHVFIFMCDHGATHIFAFPSTYLYANDLMDALTFMNTNKKYSKLVFYIEACESGSMFDGLLPATTNVYAMTASNADESSYACCYDDTLSNWLNDCWSYAWISETESAGTKQSLQKQFTVVQGEVTQSHVSQYGDMAWNTESIGDFIGYPKSTSESKRTPNDDCTLAGPVDNRDAKLVALRRIAQRSNSIKAQQDLHAEEQSRALTDTRVRALVESVSTFVFGNKLGMVDKILNGNLYSSNPSQINWDCYKGMVNAYESHCGKFDYYGMKHLRVLENFCALSVSIDVVDRFAGKVCRQS